MAQRAWFAWHCLPRDEKGRPPSWRSLEADHGLSNATLKRLVDGKLPRPGMERLERMAEALGVTPQWLHSGRGEGPLSRWPVPPYPVTRLPVSDADASDFSDSAEELLQPDPLRRRATRK
jgi:lambda repressor-like predicted transcriptional regulator